MNELVNNQEKWSLLYNHIINLSYGDTIFHNEISNIIEEDIGSTKYYSIINKTKKKLLEAGKTVKPVIGQGYIIINPDNYVDLSLGHIKRGFKQIDKGYEILQFAPVNNMSKEGLQTYRHVSDRAMSLQAMVAGGCTELKMLNKKQSKLLPINN
jgi:hypothetical protein